MTELYVVYDKISATFGMPVAFSNRAIAVRYIKNQFIGQNAYLAQDSDIYFLGCYDQFTAKMELRDNPEFVCNVGEVLGNE